MSRPGIGPSSVGGEPYELRTTCLVMGTSIVLHLLEISVRLNQREGRWLE
jgi:hypothetical protein